MNNANEENCTSVDLGNQPRPTCLRNLLRNPLIRRRECHYDKSKQGWQIGMNVHNNKNFIIGRGNLWSNDICFSGTVDTAVSYLHFWPQSCLRVCWLQPQITEEARIFPQCTATISLTNKQNIVNSRESVTGGRKKTQIVNYDYTIFYMFVEESFLTCTFGSPFS